MILYMKNQLELRQMRYFLAVAETLHFGRAAKKLRMAQPNLSLQIRRIEKTLGYDLFIRTTRGVALTAAGVFLAARAGSLQTSFDEAIQTAQRIADGQEGTLTISFSGSAMYIQMPPFEAFRDAESDHATLAHGLTHWTEHPQRQCRDLGCKSWNDAGYAAEELIAKLASAFICVDLNLAPETQE
jgi:DNA-binding transcriptional LysR family regulator